MQEKPGIGTILRSLKPSQKHNLKTLNKKLSNDIASNTAVKLRASDPTVKEIEEKVNRIISTRLSSFLFNTHSAARSAFIG